MTEPEIKPCPFCGGEARNWKTDLGPPYQTSFVRCTKCRAEIGRCDLDAEIYWNTRATPEATSLKQALLQIAAICRGSSPKEVQVYQIADEAIRNRATPESTPLTEEEKRDAVEIICKAYQRHLRVWDTLLPAAIEDGLAALLEKYELRRKP